MAYDAYAPRGGAPKSKAKAKPKPEPKTETPATAETVAAAELRQFIERVEHLAEEKTALQDDIKEVYAEAKGRGYDTKAMRKIIAIRKKGAAEYNEEQAILETYMSALGMQTAFDFGEGR